MTPEQIAQNAAALRNAGFPDFANRWLEMTPERWDAHEYAIARMSRAQERKFSMPKMENVMKPGPKEQALRAARTTEGEAAKQAEAKPEAKTTESKVRTPKTKTTKAAKKPASRTAVKGHTAAKAPEGGIRPGSKLETIVGLLKRPEGCTAKECMDQVGWPAISMPQQARAAGIKLRKEKAKGEVTRYYAA